MLKRLLANVLFGSRPVPAAPLRVGVISFQQPLFPCARLRILDPLARCSEPVEVRYVVRLADPNIVFQSAPVGFEAIFDRAVAEWAQVIVVQRDFPRLNTSAVCDYVLASGKPVVYETDDCLPELAEFRDNAQYRQPFMQEFAARAALVTVSTDALRDYFLPWNSATVVLPNYLDETHWPQSLTVIRGARERIRLGYYGHASHAPDLAPMTPVLRRLLDEWPQLDLVFLGCAPEGLPPSERCTVLQGDYDYAAFPRRLAELDLDLAIAPLLNSAFNRCRSNLKFLEFGFLGIPGVFADIPAYRNIIGDDTGVVCGESADEWYQALTRLISDRGLRLSMGAAAQREVRSNWMLKAHAHRWRDAYSSLTSDQ